MKTRLKKIGNSKGNTLSKSLLDQYRIKDELEIIASEDGLLIRPATSKSREGWEKQFRAAMKTKKDSQQVIKNCVPNCFDETDWTW
jgi:antitoxin MazE